MFPFVPPLPVLDEGIDAVSDWKMRLEFDVEGALETALNAASVLDAFVGLLPSWKVGRAPLFKAYEEDGEEPFDNDDNDTGAAL